MTKEEFINKTEIEADDQLFEKITLAYLASSFDKDEFCELVKNGGLGLALDIAESYHKSERKRMETFNILYKLADSFMSVLQFDRKNNEDLIDNIRVSLNTIEEGLFVRLCIDKDYKLGDQDKEYIFEKLMK